MYPIADNLLLYVAIRGTVRCKCHRKSSRSQDPVLPPGRKEKYFPTSVKRGLHMIKFKYLQATENNLYYMRPQF